MRPWLPEPVLEADELAADGIGEYVHDLSVGLMLTLERAAFLLHDVFDMDYGKVATLLERDEATCRQLAACARGHVRAARPRLESPPDGGLALARALVAASPAPAT